MCVRVGWFYSLKPYTNLEKLFDTRLIHVLREWGIHFYNVEARVFAVQKTSMMPYRIKTKSTMTKSFY